MAFTKRKPAPPADTGFPLDRLRLEKGMSKRRLSKLAKVAYPMVCRHCKPDANPNWRTIQKYRKALGLPWDFLFKGRSA